MDFWAIVGDANTRKSATIRALTGASVGKGGWELRLTGPRPADVKAIVHLQSPQEGKLEDRLMPAQFVAKMLSRRHADQSSHAIFPLRHDGDNGYPDAATYLDHIINIAKWNCLGIALTGFHKTRSPLLAAYPGLAFCITPNHFPFASANGIAAQIRPQWNIA